MKRKKEVILPVATYSHHSSANSPTFSTSSPSPDYFLTVQLVGDHSVGKTAFITKAVTDEFIEESATKQLPANDTKTIEIGEKLIQIVLLDGSSEKQNADEIDAKIFIFDITDYASFVHARQLIMNHIRDNQNSKIPILIVANKYDLPDKRIVEDSEIREFIDQLDTSCEIVVCGISTKNGTNIDEFLTRAVAAICRSKGYLLRQPAKNNNSHKLNFSLKHLHHLHSDWENAIGETEVQKAIYILSKYNHDSFGVWGLLTGNAWRWGVNEVEVIVKNHIETEIPTIHDLVAKLHRIPGEQPGSYLSDLVKYLQEKMYNNLEAPVVEQKKRKKS